MKNTIAEKVALLLLQNNAITLNPKKPYKYASGILSPVYTDCRILISFPSVRGKIRDLYIKNIKNAGKFDVIAGTATAGIPHASFIAEKLNLPMIYVRGKPKDHGKGNQIEGKLFKNQKVAVIEDLISTGQSSVESVNAIRQSGAKSSYIFCIITYGMKKATDNFKTNKVNLVPLTNFETVVEVAKNKGYIKEEEQKIILEWIKDPLSWGKIMGFE